MIESDGVGLRLQTLLQDALQTWFMSSGSRGVPGPSGYVLLSIPMCSCSTPVSSWSQTELCLPLLIKRAVSGFGPCRNSPSYYYYYYYYDYYYDYSLLSPRVLQSIELCFSRSLETSIDSRSEPGDGRVKSLSGLVWIDSSKRRASLYANFSSSKLIRLHPSCQPPARPHRLLRLYPTHCLTSLIGCLSIRDTAPHCRYIQLNRLLSISLLHQGLASFPWLVTDPSKSPAVVLRFNYIHSSNRCTAAPCTFENTGAHQVRKGTMLL